MRNDSNSVAAMSRDGAASRGPPNVGSSPIVGAVTLLVVNLRWEAWMVFYRRSSLYQTSADLPLWAINLLIVVVVGWTTIALARRGRGG